MQFAVTQNGFQAHIGSVQRPADQILHRITQRFVHSQCLFPVDQLHAAGTADELLESGQPGGIVFAQGAEGLRMTAGGQLQAARVLQADAQSVRHLLGHGAGKGTVNIRLCKQVDLHALNGKAAGYE